MAYFNHAFQKTLVGVEGLVNDTDKKVWDFGEDANGVNQPGKIAFIGTKGGDKDAVIDGSTEQPFIIAASSLRTKDMIGKFHGGFMEANKTKIINPKFVHKIYRVNPTEPVAAVVKVGNTDATFNTCTKSFYCGTYYYLRVDVKGSPVLSVLQHNAYSNVPAYISCCDFTPDSSGNFDPLVNNGAAIYYEWAKAIKNNMIFDGFIVPAVAFYNGSAWKYYVKDAADKAAFVAGSGIAAANVEFFDAFETATASTVANSKAGMMLVGSYVDTTFGTCSFKKNDGRDFDPVRIYASEADVEGNECFNGICVKEIQGKKGMGYGFSAIRRVILDELYHQRSFSDCPRKREIEGNDAILSLIDQNTKYPSIYIEHSVPRYNNPTSTFDNDNYLVEIIGDDEAIDDVEEMLAKLCPDVDIEVYGDTDPSPIAGEIKSIKLSKSKIAVGATTTLKVFMNPDDAVNTTAATSATTSVATVSGSGNTFTVTGVAAGTSVISVGTFTTTITVA